MAHSLETIRGKRIVVGLSGGVDSAVAALRLVEAGADVQALHMTNWEDDDGYCSAAQDLQDTRGICERLGIPLHHVNFAREYRERVFRYFLDEYGRGRTPNPDVLCNREIKFGSFLDYAKRLGAELIATGHYARTAAADGGTHLLKSADPDKDQTYFLHAVPSAALSATIFPLGDLSKEEVRQRARDHGLAVHDKKDSTGICFIGERPFREFLSTYLPARPGPILTLDRRELGRHSGLMYYTLGQRQGLGIGGRQDADDLPWYVVDKRLDENALIVDQGESLWLYSDRLRTGRAHWIGDPPQGLHGGRQLFVKIRHRQPDQAAIVTQLSDGAVDIDFERSQRGAAPGQFAVLYEGDRCLGGGVIERILSRPGVDAPLKAAVNT